MVKKWGKRFINHISQEIGELSNRFRSPSQRVLLEWFENLWQILEKMDQQGLAIHGVWYQTKMGLKLMKVPKSEVVELDNTSFGQPMYQVRILLLPPIRHDHKIYRPEISETTLVAGILPNTLPEILSWSLTVTIKGARRKPIFPPIEFRKTQSSTLESRPFYKALFIDGKELTTYQVKLFKSIIDSSVSRFNVD